MSTEIYLAVIAHLFAVPAVGHLWVYRRVPWWGGRTGAALMNMARAIALLYVVYLVGFWWTFPHYDLVLALVATYLGGAITYQFCVMLQLKRMTSKGSPR